MQIFMKLLSGLAVLALIVGAAAWTVGARQPSHAIYEHDSVIFVAVRQDQPGDTAAIADLAQNALWKADTLFAFIGTNEANWSQFFLLAPDNALIADLGVQPGLADVYAAEVELTKVPTALLGFLRIQHLLGITQRPQGALPASIDVVEGRSEILPSQDGLEAALAQDPATQVTMLNYLEYFADDNGSKAQARADYGRYGVEAFKAVHAVGGQFLFAGEVKSVLIPAQQEPMPIKWDDVAAMIYPDPTAILAMEQFEDYTRALGDRDKGLERTRIIATQTF